MKIQVLGSGGGITIPKPFCACGICQEAIQLSGRYQRTGPSYFLHGPDVLFDTPEEIKHQLIRSNIQNINAAIYSHWHPDHVMGRRVWESNMDWHNPMRQPPAIPIFLPENTIESLKTMGSTYKDLEYYQSNDLVTINHMPNFIPQSFGSVNITSFPMAEDYVASFMLEDDDKKLLFITDEHIHWEPSSEHRFQDCVIMPMGISEFKFGTNERLIPKDSEILKHEATFDFTIDILKFLKPKRAVLSHIEEPDQVSYKQLKEAEPRLSDSLGFPMEFSYDQMMIDI
jgi:phosphoribosyl 1,2-cyclic phosphate phosphodiesterase